jgi:hypothetical protein
MVDHLPLLRSSRQYPLLPRPLAIPNFACLPPMLESRVPNTARLQDIAHMISVRPYCSHFGSTNWRHALRWAW